MERIQYVIGILCAVGALLVWGVTMDGLPPRVDKLEQAVAEHEKRLAESGVKIDIILDDVKTIKGYILQRGDFPARLN